MIAFELNSDFILVKKINVSGTISLRKNWKIFENEDEKWRRRKSTYSLFAIWETFFLQWYLHLRLLTLWKKFSKIFFHLKDIVLNVSLIDAKKAVFCRFLVQIRFKLWSVTFDCINTFEKFFYSVHCRLRGFRYHCKKNVFHIANNEEVDFFLLPFPFSFSNIFQLFLH